MVVILVIKLHRTIRNTYTHTWVHVKTGEIWIRSVVEFTVLCQCQFLYFYIVLLYSMIMLIITWLYTLSKLIELYIYYFLNKFIYFVYYFWLRWAFVAAHGLSLVAESGGYSSLRFAGFSPQWLLLLRSMGSRCVGFSSCGTRASVVVARGLSSCGSRAQAQQLWRTGLVALQHVGSSRTGAWTRVPWIGRWILFF